MGAVLAELHGGGLRVSRRVPARDQTSFIIQFFVHSFISFIIRGVSEGGAVQALAVRVSGVPAVAMEVVDSRKLRRRNVKRFRGGLVFKAHRLLYHSTPGSRVRKEKRSLGIACSRSGGGNPQSHRGTSLIRNSAPLGL